MIRAQIAIGVMTVGFVLAQGYQYRFRPDTGVPPRIPLKEFTGEFKGADWSEARFDLDEAIAKRAGVSEYINYAYTRERDGVWFYVGYYDGKKIEGLHQPEICFPGSGWTQTNKKIENFDFPNVGTVPFNTLEFEKQNHTRYTIYTFFYEGKFQPEQAAIERGRTFGDRHFAIITVSANVRQSVDETRALIQELLEDLIPTLVNYLPAPP